MALYSFKASTEDGRIVKNKVNEISKLALIKKLKDNGLYPIEITQIKSKRDNESYKRRCCGFEERR